MKSATSQNSVKSKQARRQASEQAHPLAKRFRGLLPVVVDLETSGLLPESDALLELAAVFLAVDTQGRWSLSETFCTAVEPFAGARIDPGALEITGIKIDSPWRDAIPEKQALHRLFSKVQSKLLETGCYRAILVGHNAWFDLSFLRKATERAQIHENPFHGFTTIDTASLSALCLGETVLARALKKSRIYFDIQAAHAAQYDAEKTAELFCYLLNETKLLNGRR